MIRRVLPLLTLLAGLALQAADPPILERLRLNVFDAFQQIKPRAPQDAPVRIVDLDDESLSRLGQWPWPRTRVAELIRRLDRMGASAIALDIVFSEPDRTSPAAGEGLPDHDLALAEAVGRAPVVAGFSFTAEPTGRPPALKAGFAHAGDDPRKFVAGFKGAVVNLPAIESSAAGNGHFNMLAEPDGILRRVPLLLGYSDTLYPSLVAEALRVAQGSTAYVVKTSTGSGEAGWGSRTGIVSVKVGELVIPTDSRGRAWLYDTGHIAGRFIPAWRVLAGEIAAEEVEGKIVFVGTSAVGLKDIRTTPLNPVAAGVEVHAQLAEQAVLGAFLNRPDWAPGAEFLFLLCLGVALLALMPRVGAAWCALGGAAAIGTAWAWSWWAFTIHRRLLDPFFPSLVAAALYTVSSLLHFLQVEAQRRRVRNAFSRYLSPEIVRRLAEHPEQLKLGGERKVMTLLFMDIRRFTTIAEQLDAEELTRFLNQFLTPMTDAILKSGGTIDKYIGDCIMAFWNAPLDDPLHARHACAAALGMRRMLVDWNRQRYAEALDPPFQGDSRGQAQGKRWAPVRIGIGINTGECCVGNLGSEQRFDYSVVGDAVNLASRLEGQSKAYGVDIVLGEETRLEGGPELAALELDFITVKGKTKPVRIYALLGGPETRSDPAFQALAARHEELLAAYRARRWDLARALLDDCRSLDTRKTRLRSLYALYAQRIRACEASPPPPDWDGVFVAPSK